MQDISTVSSDVEQAMTYEILQQYEKAQQKYKKSIEGQDMNSQVCITTIKDMLCTITYKSRLTTKKWHKKTDLFLASMGKTGLSHDIFFKFSVGPFEVVEVK